MAKIVRKQISFRECDRDALEFLKSKSNASRYIVQLIRADMKGSNLDDKIRKIVTEELKKQKGESQYNLDVRLDDMF